MPKRDPQCRKCNRPVPGGGDCPWCAFDEGRIIKRADKLRKSARRRSETTPSVAIFICFNGHKWPAEVDPRRGIDTRLFTCPTCDAESRVEKILRAKKTGTKCCSRCWLAENPWKCECECAGLNHGTGGPPLSDDEMKPSAA